MILDGPPLYDCDTRGIALFDCVTLEAEGVLFVACDVPRRTNRGSLVARLVIPAGRLLVESTGTASTCEEDRDGAVMRDDLFACGNGLGVADLEVDATGALLADGATEVNADLVAMPS